jgi:hypothetical protein
LDAEDGVIRKQEQEQNERKNSMILQSKIGGDFKPHAEGIYPAVCVDVIDLGLLETEFQGQRRLAHKVRLVFETEQKNEDGKNCTLAKSFTANLNSKAKLAEFLGKWRGRPIVPGETIDLGKLLGACCTLVISHQQNMVGRTYASIDAVSKPTKRLTASGGYDPVLARQRIEEWKAREMRNGPGGQAGQRTEDGGRRPEIGGQRPEDRGQRPGGAAATVPKSGAPSAAQQAEIDPEVGF